MPSLPIEGWAVAHAELERWFYRGSEPDQVFVLRNAQSWTLVVLCTADRPDGASTGLRGHGLLSAEIFFSVDDLADAIRERYTEAAWVQLVDAGRDDPDLHGRWVPTRVERDFDRASLHDPDLALRCAGRQVAGWHLSAVERMAEHLESQGFEVARLRMAMDVDDQTSANPVLGVVEVSRYGAVTPGVVRVDDAGEVYVRPPFDDPVERWDLVDVGGVRPEVAEPGAIEW